MSGPAAADDRGGRCPLWSVAMVGPARAYVHIGVPKSGTTHLQALLWRNRDLLRAKGVLYPGNRSDLHFLATLDLLGESFHGHVDPAAAGAWDRVAAQVRAWPGTSVISHEMLAQAGEDAVRRAMRSLRGVEVHVVCTARDLARQLPAVWQENVKNRGRLTFEQFSRALRGVDGSWPRLARNVWSYQDLPVVLRNWGAQLPPSRVHVIPVPRAAAPDTLWRRFAEACGIDPDCGLAGVGARNVSLGAVETHLLRRLNRTGVADELPWPAYEKLVKEYLALDVLGGRPAPVPLRLPAADLPWVQHRAKEMIESLRAAGYHVVGDLAELLPADSADKEPRHPDDVSDAELLDASVHALAGLLRLARRTAAPSPDLGLRAVLVARYQHLPPVRWLLRRYRLARVRARAMADRVPGSRCGR